MKVFLNNESVEVNNSIYLMEILKLKNLEQKKGIAVAVNNQIIPKMNWEKYTVSENDKLMVIQATQGG